MRSPFPDPSNPLSTPRPRLHPSNCSWVASACDAEAASAVMRRRDKGERQISCAPAPMRGVACAKVLVLFSRGMATAYKSGG